MTLDPDNENFANHVKGSIQHFKQKKMDLEEGIKVQKEGIKVQKEDLSNLQLIMGRNKIEVIVRRVVKNFGTRHTVLTVENEKKPYRT